MKNSTVGIGIAFLFFVAGTGIWFCADATSPGLSGETQAAFAEELKNDFPAPLSESTPGSEPSRLTPRQSLAKEPEYLILGQQPGRLPQGTPQGTLTRRDTGKANPLRDMLLQEEPRQKEQNSAAPPQNLPNQNRVAQPLPQPGQLSSGQTGRIVQAALQSENEEESEMDGETPRSQLSGFAAGFSSLPAPPAQQDSLLEAAGFETEGSLSSVSRTPAPPTPTALEVPMPTQSQTAVPTPATPLQNADPFAANDASSAAAVPPIAAPLAAHPTPPSVPETAMEPKVTSSNPFGANTPSEVLSPTPQPNAPNALRSPESRAAEGTGMPGAVTLDGVQSAHLTVEKVLPSEIIIEQPTTVKLVIKNTGKSTAKGISVLDRVPQGARLLSCSPETTPNANGELLWSLGNLDPNEQLAVEMRVLPLREGEIGSVATVHYSAEASARINVTRPLLKVDVKVPQEVQLGETINLEITISNPGTATATGIVLTESIPDGLYHEDGKVLEHKGIGSLKPKEKKLLVLPLTCTGPGDLVNHLVVKANNNLHVEEKTAIRALAPILELGIVGPQQRFLERKATYNLTVANSGSASAQNVDLVATLPSAVKFVSTNQSGVYEPKTHTVHWALEELPSQEAGEIELVVLPAQIGEHAIRFTGNGQNNLKSETVKSMSIDGLPALSFEVVGSSNLLEVGKDVVYEIRVANKGTKSANNVKVQAKLSEGMTFVKAEGSPTQSNGGVIAFSPLSQLEAKGEKVFKVAARCTTDGDHRFSVQIVSDDMGSPITKEESTRVFQ